MRNTRMAFVSRKTKRVRQGLSNRLNLKATNSLSELTSRFVQ